MIDIKSVHEEEDEEMEDVRQNKILIKIIKYKFNMFL